MIFPQIQLARGLDFEQIVRKITVHQCLIGPGRNQLHQIRWKTAFRDI